MVALKNNGLKRAVAVLMATILLLGILPVPGVTAATEHHAGAVTITVLDAEGAAVGGASVHYVITGKDSEPVDNTKITDEYGTVEVLSGEDFAEGAYRISATVTRDSYLTATLSEQSITSADQDFAVTLEKEPIDPTPETITDITVTATNKAYTGEEFPAVTISGTREGDTVTVSVNGEETVLDKNGTNLPKIKDVGSYEVTVTVSRDGFADYSVTVTSEISKNTLKIEYRGIFAKYEEGKEYAAIELVPDTTLPEVDFITYSLNGGEPTAEIPMISAVGTYTIHVHAKKAGYEDFNQDYTSEITLGTLDNLDNYDVKINPVKDLVYNGEAQQLITISGDGKDLFTYTITVEGDADEYSSAEDLLKTNAGDYMITVTLHRDNYEDIDYAPIIATIAKAEQTIRFAENSFASDYEDKEEASISFSGENCILNFSVIVDRGKQPDEESDSSIQVQYVLEYPGGQEEKDFAEIDSNGNLTISGIGTVIVSATQVEPEKSNYKNATISFTLSVIPAENAELVRFGSSSVEYELGTKEGTVSNEKAALVPLSEFGVQDRGEITYHFSDKTLEEDYGRAFCGLSLNDNNEVNVDDYAALVTAMEKAENGIVTIYVVAEKAASGLYSSDSASYTINIKFAEIDEKVTRYTFEDPDGNELTEPNGSNKWYKTSVVVCPAKGYTIARTINKDADGFDEKVKIEDQGEGEKYIYLRNADGGICPKILLDGLKIDSVQPADCSVSYTEPSPEDTIRSVLTLGFYQSSVAVTFNAMDDTSGVESFEWWYVEEGAEKTDSTKINTEDNVKSYDKIDEETGEAHTFYTATIILTTEEYKQMRGTIFAVAVDKAGNVSENPSNSENTDNSEDKAINGFVLDDIKPEVSLTYSDSKSTTESTNDDDKTKYYDKNGVEFTLEVTEANFDSDDVTVTVNEETKQVSWSKDENKEDSPYIGTFSIEEDGHYTVTIGYTDKSGNPMMIMDKTKSTEFVETKNGTYTIPYKLVVDRIAPKVTEKYSDPSAKVGNDRYYNTSATLTLTFEEANFFSEDVKITVSREDGKTPKATVDWNGHDATITIPAQDGHYTVTANYTDRSGNEMPTFTSERITIDTTAPTIGVSYDNNDLTNEHYFTDAANETFFKAGRVATITVEEHNFDPEKVTISATAADPEAEAPEISAWTTDGDTHTAKVRFLADGDYTFDVSAIDIAGNKSGEVDYGNSAAPKEFTVDTNAEMIVIAPNSVKEGVAYTYDDVLIPDITISDENLEGYEITLKGVQRSNTIDLTQQINALVESEDNLATALLDVFEKTADLDGIYTLTVRSTDRSDNTDEQTVRFTVNRFGSVYEYGDGLMALIADGGTYNQRIGEDLTLTVYNASPIDTGNISVVITRDGRPVEAVFTVSETTADADGWYSYLVIIDKSNFADDGVYRISVTATDNAENTVENTLDNSDGDILFYVDSTAPQLTAVSGLEERIVNATELEVTYTVYDTVGLASVQVKVDGQIVDTATEFDDASNYTGAFKISEKSTAQHISFVLTDKAGNVTESDAEGFKVPYTLETDVTVSTNLFVRWFANKLLFWGSIGGVAVLGGGICALVALKKKKKAHKAS